jgi:hypothetical protein
VSAEEGVLFRNSRRVRGCESAGEKVLGEVFRSCM